MIGKLEGLKTPEQRLQAYGLVMDLYKSHVETLRAVNLGFLAIAGALCAYVGKAASGGDPGDEAATGGTGLEVWSLLLLPMIALSLAYAFRRASQYISQERVCVAKLREDLGMQGFPPTLEIVGDLFWRFSLMQLVIGAGVTGYFGALQGYGPGAFGVLAAAYVIATGVTFWGKAPGRVTREGEMA